MPEYLEDVRSETKGWIDEDALAAFIAEGHVESAERFEDNDTRSARDDFAAIVGQLLQATAAMGVGMPARMVVPDEAADAIGLDRLTETGPMGLGYMVADLADLLLRDPLDQIPTRDTPFDR